MAKLKSSWRCMLINLELSLIAFLLLVVVWKREGNIWKNLESEPLLAPEHLLVTDQRQLLPCSAIIRGDAEEEEEADLQRMLATRKKSVLLSEDFYLNATQDCSAYLKERRFLTVTLSEDEKNFPIAYSVVVHEKIEMFERLLRAVYTPQNVYCVHVDKKSPKKFQDSVRAIVSCLPNVFVASRLERVVYASWSRVQADLNCMEDLLKSPVQWKYLLNTCGTDFPIKTNAEIIQNLKWLNGKNSMESEETPEHKKKRWLYHHNVTDIVSWTNIEKSPPPISSPMFSGNAYFVVTRDFVRHVFESQEVQNLIEWEKDTYSPDEHLWATLLRMPNVPGSYPAHSKYQLSDMNALARLVKWADLEGAVTRGAPYLQCSGEYRRAVCVFGAGDLHWILQQHHLLANKFDPEVDDVALTCLEAYLRYKAFHRELV